MNKFFISSALALAAASASAGVRIETITRDATTKAPKGVSNVTEVQAGSVRSSHETGSMILKAGVVYLIDDSKKTYSEMDKATMKAYATKASAAMAQMQDQLKSMTPEQRAMMEKMMGNKMPGAGKPVVFDAKATGKSDTVEGRSCKVWNLTQDGAVIDELCVVPFNTLPGKEDMEKSMKELAEAFSGFASAVPNAAEQVKVRTSIQGYPVRSRPYVNGKPSGFESVLKSWTEVSMPAATFEVPKGYKKKEMPQVGGM